MHAQITYKVAEREFGNLPFESLYAWATEHDAQESFLRLLSQTMFRWGNPDMSIVVRFCGPDDTFKLFYHDAASEHMETGDVVFNMSLVNKQLDYRMDQIRVYKWIETRNEWRWHKERIIYYSRTFPFGGYTKRMPDEWGIARERLGPH